MDSFKIGQVAEAVGIGVETVRFYEREGLIPQPTRRKSKYRKYPPETVAQLRFIRRAKELGFTLKQIGELLDLRGDPGATCGDVRHRAQEKIADLERRIADLRRMRQALATLVDDCEGEGPLRGCPIVEALEHGSTP